MIALKVQEVGDRFSVELDEEARRALGVKHGDLLVLKQTDAGPVLSPQPAQPDAIAIGREIMIRYRKTFEALAK